jgi:hypothetical protein
VPMQIRVIFRCCWICYRGIAASQREPDMVKRALLQFWSEYGRSHDQRENATESSSHNLLRNPLSGDTEEQRTPC